MVTKVLVTCLLVTVVHSIELMSHPNGAVVPSEEAAVLAARAHHQAAIEAKTVDDYSAAIKAAHAAQLVNTGVFPQVGDAAAFLNNFNLVSYPNGAVVPSEGAAILADRAKHFAAINAANMDQLAKNNLAKPMGQALANSLVDFPSNLVFHPNGAVVPSEDAAILAARAHNLAAQAAHINLLANSGLNIPPGYPASAALLALGSLLPLNLLSPPYGALTSNGVSALQTVLASLANNEAANSEAPASATAALQAVIDNLAAKEAASLEASAAAKAALLSNSGLKTPVAPTSVSSPLGLNLVTYPNGAIVPAEGSAILAARASHQAAHDATTSGALSADHSAVHSVADADHSVAHGDDSTQFRHDSIKLVSHPGGAVAPAEGFALATARAKHLAAHIQASADVSTSIEAKEAVNVVTEEVEP